MDPTTVALIAAVPVALGAMAAVIAHNRFVHHRRLPATENRIQAARRFYNSNNVRDDDQRVQSVPTDLVARAAGFTERSYVELDRVIRSEPAPQVRLGPAPSPAGEPEVREPGGA